MAKESGIGFTVAIDDSGAVARTITNDISNLTISCSRAMQDTTGLDKSGHEQLPLLADLALNYNGTFNDASNMSHDVFKTTTSTSVIRTATNTVSAQILAGEVYLTSYDLTRGADGSFVWSVPAVLGDGTAPTWTT